MTRTTLDLDATVLQELRDRATRDGKSMGVLASELLAPVLADAPEHEPRPLEWISRNLGPFKVDIEDKEAVQRALDGEE